MTSRNAVIYVTNSRGVFRTTLADLRHGASPARLAALDNLRKPGDGVEFPPKSGQFFSHL